MSVTQTDSIFTIDQGIFINKKQKFRNQQVAVLISVPVGKRISLPKSNAVSNYDDDVWEFQNWNNTGKTNQEFQMTDEGLKPVGEVDSLDKPNTLDKRHKLDSLIELKQKIEQEIDQQRAFRKSI
jgi:hypothetical protein